MNQTLRTCRFRAAVICLGLILFAPLSAGAASLSLTPVPPVAKGVLFQIDIYADTVTNAYGLAMDLKYDPAALAIVDGDTSTPGVQPEVLEGDVFNNGGTDSTILKAALENGTQGRLVFGLSRTETDTGVDIGANKKLASISFIPLIEGPATITIENNTFYNPDTTELAIDSWTGATLDILPSFTVTAATGGHGAIVPSGNVLVAQGYDKSFAFLPDSGYVLDYLEIDTVNTDAAASYAFTNVTEDHAITAYFRIMPGDFDGDANLTLKDAIVISRVLSGMDAGVTLNLDADADGDGKIGTIDLIYILQKLSGLR